MKTKIIIYACLICFVILTGFQISANRKPAKICLFFDDGWTNQYEEALPVLLEHEFKATFGVITGSIGTGENFWEYLGEAELKELAGYGMEIACHTRTHPHLTDNLAAEQLYEEIINSKLYLEQKGFDITTFVYPYYEWDDRIIEYVKDAGYSCARGGWPEEGAFKIKSLKNEARYHLPSQQITDQDLETFKSYSSGLDSDDIICLVYHFIADDGPETTSTPVTNFHAQMAYLKEAGFEVVLLSDLLESVPAFYFS